jgi:carnitine 3-dehydrogenase
MAEPVKVAVIGGGVIGGGWIARFLENGFDVAVFDPAPDAQGKIEAVLSNAAIAARELTDAPRPKPGILQ